MKPAEWTPCVEQALQTEQESSGIADSTRRRVTDMATRLQRASAHVQGELARWRGARRGTPALEGRLRDAMHRRALELHYQPIIDLRSMRVCSIEALLRWRTSADTWISPSDFVPLAERSGLIVPLGQWVFEEACAQAAAWRDAGIQVPPIAVNLSPMQLRDPNIVDHLLDALDATGIESSFVELELTESSLMQDLDEALPRLRCLVDHGLKLAIDDFGTGYSSLSYLRKLPFSKLKIDRSFIAPLSGDEVNMQLVSTIVQLCNALQLTTVAEGVETCDQMHALRLLGCDCSQGFYFFRPAPASELTSLLTARPLALPWQGQDAHASIAEVDILLG